MYGKTNRKPPITILDRKDITDYVRAFVLHMRNTQGRVFDTRHRSSVEYMVEMMNKPENTAFKSIRDVLGDGRPFWYEQKVDFVASNLRRGFVFYFRCNGCYRRVKYLYQYSMLKPPLCRICCRLPYPQPSRQARRFSRLIRQPYLSSEAKYMLIKRAGITAEDIVNTGI
jgi:hypothetical protein